MGYFSELAIDKHEYEREPSYPTPRQTLEFYLEDLNLKLDELEEERPHDPLDPYFDRYFYSDYIVHYYENPNTVQDVLYCIREVEELLQAIDEEDSPIYIEPVEQLAGQLSLYENNCAVVTSQAA